MAVLSLARLVEDGWQAVLVVEEEVADDLQHVHIRWAPRVPIVKHQPHEQPARCVVRRGRRPVDPRVHDPRRAVRWRDDAVARVVEAHGRRADELDRLHIWRQVVLRAPHLPLGVSAHLVDGPRARVG